jgi:hypothetical protein
MVRMQASPLCITVSQPAPPVTLPLPLTPPLPLQAYLNPDKENGALEDLESVINQSPPRAAKADIYYPTDFAATTSARGAIIFAHAFVQPSYSYTRVIRQLQEAGWVVVAPLTDVFDVLGRDVGVKINQKKADTKLQSTLQVRRESQFNNWGLLYYMTVQ